MNDNCINVLFISDVVGDCGIGLIYELLDSVKNKYKIDFTICNGENAANGKGLTKKIAEKLYDFGVDVLTSGNHLWEKPKFFDYLDSNDRVIRPLNYPVGCPGNGSGIYTVKDNIDVGVVNLQGRTFMYNIDCPFRTGGKEIEKIRKTTKIIIVDFHAEATAEKLALAWHLDGKISALIGTHTHVQTADEKILPNGTGYITDAGMTGPHDSVIGLKPDIAIKRFLYQIPKRIEISEEGGRLNAVYLKIDCKSGKTVNIERINME